MYKAEVPGKAILMGEHAVVYGRPALAMPVFGVRARAVVEPWPQAPARAVYITAEAVGLVRRAHTDLPEDHPLRVAVTLALRDAPQPLSQALHLCLESTIPMAAGLGSSAATTVAVLRALAQALGLSWDVETLNARAYEVERLYHGTPSGIDNTVVTYARPVYFRRGFPPEPLQVGGVFAFLIADTGVPASTRETVAKVREGWQRHPKAYEARFEAIGALVEAARQALARGQVVELGRLMNANQAHLEALGVSHPALERLIAAARRAGAYGAKLSGGGGGGNMIALVDEERLPTVHAALQEAGAVRLWETRLTP